MKISVDPASAVPLANDPIFLARIAPIDLLLPNEDEAAVLGPQIDVRQGVRGHARAQRRDVDATGSRKVAQPARQASTTWSTRPAPATRSPPAS